MKMGSHFPIFGDVKNNKEYVTLSGGMFLHLPVSTDARIFHITYIICSIPSAGFECSCVAFLLECWISHTFSSSSTFVLSVFVFCTDYNYWFYSVLMLQWGWTGRDVIMISITEILGSRVVGGHRKTWILKPIIFWTSVFKLNTSWNTSCVF